MKDSSSFHIYINKDAGTVHEMGQSRLEELIAKSDLNVEELHFLGAEDLIRKAADDTTSGSILIGGGDGTIRSCAAHFVKKNKGFGILPLGTMNLLAKDLNIPVDTKETLAAYGKGVKETFMDVGHVNNEIFLCCASVGMMPETSQYREKHRGDSAPLLIPRLTAYMLKQMDRPHHRRLALVMDGQRKKIKTAALVVSNNQYGPQGQWNEENFRRPSLQDNILGVYSAAPYSLWDKLRFLLNLGIGDWKKDAALKEWQCRKLVVGCAESEILVSLDGETDTFNTPLHFSLIPQGLKVIVPKEK